MPCDPPPAVLFAWSDRTPRYDRRSDATFYAPGEPGVAGWWSVPFAAAPRFAAAVVAPWVDRAFELHNVDFRSPADLAVAAGFQACLVGCRPTSDAERLTPTVVFHRLGVAVYRRPEHYTGPPDPAVSGKATLPLSVHMDLLTDPDWWAGFVDLSAVAARLADL